MVLLREAIKRGKNMKKKLVVIIICVLLAIFLLAGAIGVYFLKFHKKFDFTAEELPFGLEWGMSMQEAEDWMFNEFDLVCDARKEEKMLYDQISYNGMSVRLLLSFYEDVLRGVSLTVLDVGKSKGLVFNELKEIYRKDALLEGIYTGDYACRQYITNKNEVLLSEESSTVSLIIDDIDQYTIDDRNSRRAMVEEAEKMGVKSIKVPKNESLLSYFLPHIE